MYVSFLLQSVSSSVTIILNNSLKPFGGDIAIATIFIFREIRRFQSLESSITSKHISEMMVK